MTATPGAPRIDPGRRSRSPAPAPAPRATPGSLTQRSGRSDRPDLPSGQLQIQPPPQIQPSEGAAGVAMNAIPMLGSLGSIVLVAGLAGDRGNQTLRFIAAGMFLFATLGFIIVQIDRQRKQRQQQVTGSRTEYLRYLSTVRGVAREAADQQRRALTWIHPQPTSLPALAEDRSRVWERSTADPSFLQVRYGTCAQPLALELVPPEGAPIDDVDPASASALHRLLVVHRLQPDLPASIDLRAFDRIEICGPEEDARSMARALLCSAATFQSPENVQVAVLATDATLAHWDWVKWLPHAHSLHHNDAVGPSRMVTTSLTDLATMLPPDLSERPRFGADERPAIPHIVLITDGAELPPGNHVIPPDGLHGVTVIDLPARWGELDSASALRLEIEDGPAGQDNVPLAAVRLRTEPIRARGDLCSVATAEALARRLTPLFTPSAGASVGDDAVDITAPTDFMDLLGLGDVRSFDPDAAWRSRPARDRLRVPIGIGDGAGPIHLDIKESAQQGMGPHGLVIGATGSGKSEFLRTLVLGLAMTHSPEQLNMVLVDFKGGATFAGMSGMPHVSAVITNLANELTLVDRMQDALSGEMVRRQELLREAGNFASIRDYEKARTSGDPASAALAPLPSLFIVVDEFSELLSAKPEFIDLFVAIGRLGRSLGLHLLLASQRLEEGRLRGLESHLSYRVGLRTFSAQESRAVLGVPDAYELPAVPGLGYLKPDPTQLTRFKAAYVSGPPEVGRRRASRDSGGKVRGILPFTISEVQTFDDPGTDEAEHDVNPAAAIDSSISLLDVAVGRMEGRGPAAHQVWLPPLDAPDTLNQLMPDLAAHPDLGLVSQHWRGMGNLTIPIGTVDRPREQRRDTLTVSLSGAAGHVAVVGGPRSGKSTVLRTVVTSLALTTTPLESQFFVLDFGGGTFAPMAALPHVSGVGTRSEPEVVRRIMAEVKGIVDRREAYFRRQGIDSIETYRSRRFQQHRAEIVDDGYGDVFLVVDGWGTLRSDFDDLELEIQQLAGRGLTFGLHIVTSSTRWPDFRAAMRDVLGTRLELRLGDPIDSEIDRKVAQLVPANRPGRGLVPGKLHFLAALPRVDGDQSAATLGDGVDAMISAVAKAWRGPAGPKLRLLPDRITLDDVRAQSGTPPKRQLLLAINEKELAPVSLDVDAEPHLLLFGDGKSGKSNLLRTYCQEIVRTRTPAEAQIVVVDYRRSLLGEVPEDYLLNYLTSATQAGPALNDLATYLQNRIPGPDVTPEQLRNRSWWSGAEVFVVVDDYDLVATQQSSPVAQLQPLLAQARDVGLHVVVARRSGGAGRALYEPVIQSMRDLAMPGIMLSGNRDEGILLGNVRPGPAQPGRGRLISRDRGTEVVQLAWTEPTV